MVIMGKEVAKTWTFASSSNPNKTYEAVLYMDGSTSCGCPGWTKRPDRTCKHTRSIDEGTADLGCVGNTDYRTATPKSKTLARAKPARAEAPETGPEQVVGKVRKIQW